MSIEQTSQLIQLILNSVLMVVACVIVIGGLLVRHTAIKDRLRMLNREYFDLLDTSELLRTDRLIQTRNQLQQLKQHYRFTHNSLLAVCGALLFFIASTFGVALRTMMDWEWLINGALVLFVTGLGILLVGVGLALVDFYRSKRSLLEEINWVLNLGDGVAIEAKLKPAPQRAKPAPKSVRRTARTGEPPQPKTGAG